MKTNTCPICGSAPIIESRPLWHDNHGYKNNYDYNIKCSEPDCPMSLVKLTISTLEDTEEDIKHKLINEWNTKCDTVQKLILR